MFEGKNVLITGGAGFIGTNLIVRLLQLGANVRATLHLQDANIIDKKIEYVKCDLLKDYDCKTIVKDMDYVFHCAASTSGAAVIAQNPLIHVTPNIIMNALLLESAYFAKVKKFIWISSNAGYPPTGDRPTREEEMFDGDPYDTYYGVGWMKRYTEILCRLYSEKLKPSMPTVVLRPSNLYGPYDKFEPNVSHVMAATIRKVVERQNPIKVWGSGDDIRDLLYIDDFIDAVILSVKKINTFDPINIAYGKGYSVKQLLHICLEIEGYANAEIQYDKTKPSMIPVRLLDTKKAYDILGFKPKTDIVEGITKTIKWYKANFKGK